jgi:hypothetical protein
MTEKPKVVEAATTLKGEGWPLPDGMNRLAAALVEADARLGQLAATSADPVRVAACAELLAQARSAATARAFGISRPREYLAWDCLAQFSRQLVYLMPKDELAALWLSLKAEGKEKLSGHRREAVQEIVDVAGKSVPGPGTVATVLEHLQTTAQNRYHKLDEQRRQINWVGGFLVCLVIGLLITTGLHRFRDVSPTLDEALRLGMLLGIVGGVLSVAFTITRADEKVKIPALRSSFEVMLVRPLVGAALALPVVLIVESGAITITGLGKPWLVPVACFLAGFSERWFLGLMEGLEKKARPEPEKKAGNAR